MSQKSKLGPFHRRSPEDLLNLLGLMLKFIAKADREKLGEIPEQFLTQFSVIRNALMRKCVGPDYTEAQFREFFDVAFLIAVRDYGMTEQRANSLRTEANQFLQ